MASLAPRQVRVPTKYILFGPYRASEGVTGPRVSSEGSGASPGTQPKTLLEQVVTAPSLKQCEHRVKVSSFITQVECKQVGLLMGSRKKSINNGLLL